MGKRSMVDATWLQRIRDQVETLGGEMAPAIAKAGQGTQAVQRNLAGYAELAMRFAPQIGDLVSRLTTRGADATVAAVRQAATPLRRTGPSRLLIGGLVGVAGLIALGVLSGRIVVQVKRRPKV